MISLIFIILELLWCHQSRNVVFKCPITQTCFQLNKSALGWMCIEYINWESPWNFSQDKQSYHFWYYYSNILILGYIFSEDSIFLQAATISVLSISSSDLNKRNITMGNKNLMLFRLKSWKKMNCVYLYNA